ncbi:DUF3027 domain-containing protein [Rathayibacter sp. VKM Ac-2760]|uniref:DUF3027 domain-containing protein n=1 Tax=Rathayibacter sp. VKM Ac-2760 TaxID=2609253 RepID=UPI0013168582|nr:DUF3027 domain-containing protein [Rathayibacter sp. VKM Ac-2760]QHC59625.1 DUF3027 domain-containing protein [Rathayibacter sp. VKM Ac-2760]
MPDADETNEGLPAEGPGEPTHDPAVTTADDDSEAPVDAPEASESEASGSEDSEPEVSETETSEAEDAAPEPVYELDPVLAAAEDRAREALVDITQADTIGELVATIAQGPHVVSLQFANLMRGYPGWLWTATLSRIDESEDVNVLEVELLPGEGSVLAPDWVPWSVRLADYRAAQDAAGERDETEDDEYDDDTVVDADESDGDEAEDDELVDDDDEADDDDVPEDDDDSDDADEDDSDEDDSDDDDSDDDDSEDDDDEDSDDGRPARAASGSSTDGGRGGSGRGRRRRRR